MFFLFFLFCETIIRLLNYVVRNILTNEFLELKSCVFCGEFNVENFQNDAEFSNIHFLVIEVVGRGDDDLVDGTLDTPFHCVGVSIIKISVPYFGIWAI